MKRQELQHRSAAISGDGCTAGGDSGFVVAEDPDCYLEYKLRND